jgi:hypothetical protein
MFSRLALPLNKFIAAMVVVRAHAWALGKFDLARALLGTFNFLRHGTGAAPGLNDCPL